jgi:hypothetical protein
MDVLQEESASAAQSVSAAQAADAVERPERDV